ncbi:MULTISPECIES: aromatic ring-hydroxylating dioxygenase subunit alpha [unclassified Leptolyngbya]|uniref:aromatic ring-hydroxylating dioxygenase subunit alpha n=1 Tax=unclassified Leptolyngbya TaxID=2650499 RepID=UPI0016880E3D|nr:MULTISPECIES: aromatic ring-hydroxylating dioxygenase subunit alpha [unclassified Leptolyngbya]MBD1911738.1 aromatic ring-hydroxylating dioxygenase subunit alpha [Leptolyngbya sp. FACHB-8]MBD2157337.1 aromatic ring-hydroxylating dioxygenase subunit alpha [Leptolyngbya sp. FACHB-16]
MDSVLLNDWHVVARSEDVQPGTLTKAKLLGVDLVIWRNTASQVLVWQDRCPHRSVRLSGGEVVNDTVVCPYHGLVFNDVGQCIEAPAHPGYTPPKQACVKAFKTHEQYGLIYASLGEPVREIPVFSEWNDPSYRLCLSGPYHCHTSGLRAIENFLDVSHFPFVHPGTLGDRAQTAVEDYTVSTDEDGVALHNVRVWQPDPDGQGKGEFVTYNYRAFRPLTAYFRKETPNGNCLAILFHVTPVEEEECVGWMWVAMNYAHDTPTEEVQKFQDHLIVEDFVLLETHNPKRLPLDLQLEFHLPCDRGSLAYRKWLKQLGLTYGAIAEPLS